MNLKLITDKTNDWIFRVGCNDNIGLLNTVIEIVFFWKIEALKSGPKDDEIAKWKLLLFYWLINIDILEYQVKRGCGSYDSVFLYGTFWMGRSSKVWCYTIEKQKKNAKLKVRDVPGTVRVENGTLGRHSFLQRHVIKTTK